MHIESMSSVLMLWVLLSVCPVHAITRTIPTKTYSFEEVCSVQYGTILNHFFKINDKEECGVKCSERAGCQSFNFNSKSGYCSINSDMMVNKTNTGCTPIHYGEISTVDTIRHAPPPTHCGPVPYMSSILVDKSSGNYSIGSQLPYICTPCTFFPPASSPGVITCGPDGRWIIPSELCVYGPDVGYLRTGEPIPPNAVGCGSAFNDTCANNMLSSGFRFFGNITGFCYCDSACCGAGDCCFDSTCTSNHKEFYTQNYIYDDYYYYY